MGPDSCKVAFDSYCTASNNSLGCECYSSAGLQNQECTTLRNMMKGISSCTQSEITDYIKNNNICATQAPVQTYNRMQAIRDYITSEDYDTTVVSKEPDTGFWHWLFRI